MNQQYSNEGFLPANSPPEYSENMPTAPSQQEENIQTQPH